MFEVVVVMLERAFRVAGRADEEAFDLPAVKRQQRLDGFEVSPSISRLPCVAGRAVLLVSAWASISSA
ncbi:MAG: hypothetical protein ABJA84_09015 [Polaromonas sp.]